MKTKKLGTFLTAAALSIASLSACSNGENNENMNDDADSTLVIPVEVMDVSRGTISAYYSNTATLEAVEEANIVSKVRGIIQEINVEEGDEVRAGQVIAKIEDDQYRIEAERAKATLDRMFNDFQRNKELFDKQLISAEVYENSRFEYEAQKSAYELAQLNYQHTSIKSPITGVISERMVKKGNMIGIDQQVFRVTDFDPIQAILYVPEHERSKIRKGQRAELLADAIPGTLFTGKVERISPTIDPTTGTFKVTIYMDQNQDFLRPGMFGRVKIVYDTRENTKMIPKAAIISEDETQSVFVIKDSLAFRKNIRTGYINGTNIEVIDGLEDGEMVVTTGQGSLTDSTKVNIVRL
ncbi:MAG: efflux RND transporter periplasmic adaptor subunit [bacterium]|jgi:membrane fusion protein (multidrug efflux system)|nr:efflux RND transporter periplasmic adaptor subunit [bacterium]